MNWGDNWAGAQLVQSINPKAYNSSHENAQKSANTSSVGAGLMMTPRHPTFRVRCCPSERRMPKTSR